MKDDSSDALLSASAEPVIPDGSTHYWPQAPGARKWRRLLDGEWYEWCGKWLPLDHAIPDKYVAIEPAKGGDGEVDRE